MTATDPKGQSSLRILMVAACPFPWPRGTPIRILRLAEALVQQGHSVDVVTYHLGKPVDTLPFKVHRTAKVFYYDRVSAGPSLTKLFLLDPMLVHCLLRIGKQQRFDIIHAHHIEGLITSLAARALGLKLPIIYDAHTLIGSELIDYGPPIGAGFKRIVGDFLDFRFARSADSVIAVTDTIKNALEIRGGLPASRVCVIANGVEESFLKLANKARRDATASEVEENSATAGIAAPVFLFAGNTSTYQGIDLMLKAFALVLKRVPTAKLWILTDQSFAKYQRLVDGLGISDALSVMDVDPGDLPGTLVQGDVLLNPRTRCAGIPQKLLNYMSTGRPVVSFAGSAKILNHRVDGLVVNNGDIQGFADAMLELSADRELGESLSEAALKLILARYSWSSVARQTQIVYRDTLIKHAERHLYK